MDKISYALGLSMGNNFLNTGIKTINIEDFARGVRAVYGNEKPEMTYDEAKRLINEFFTKLQNEIAESAKLEADSFLAGNAKNPNVVVLESGLQYEILKEGNGPKPELTSQVKCHYHGSLLDGRVFDSSVERGEPAVFGVNQVIKGWQEALPKMLVGSHWKLFIPSDLAYGANGAGDMIPPYSALIFEVELLDIV